MTTEIAPKITITETLLIKIARDIAMDILPFEDILKIHGVGAELWAKISSTPRFTELLVDATREWASAGNTHERVKVKAAAMVEEWLPELHERLHDHREALSAKTEAAKLLRDLAGMGKNVDTAVAGEKFNITINLGSDQMKIEKSVPTQVIDMESL